MTELQKDYYKLRQRRCIAIGDWLNEDHIDEFATLFNTAAKFAFNMRPQWCLYFLENLEPVLEYQKHIQILFSCEKLLKESLEEPSGGHWVCSYYDGKQLWIYDSNRGTKLHEYHKIYLKRLLPFYDFDRIGAVLYPSVDRQKNPDDSALFAMAFAVSILFRLKPEKVRYSKADMRSHLLKILESQQIQHFPRDTFDTNVVLPLKLAHKRRKAAESLAYRRALNKIRIIECSSIRISQVVKEELILD